MQGAMSFEDLSSEGEDNNYELSNLEELDLNPADLEQIALIYDQIRALYRNLTPGGLAQPINPSQVSQIDKKLASEFDSHLKTVMLNLSNALRS